mmetsp:Transcript_15541/g.50749  ORF Transcript_15541/g.50749 Transcript_15541/m.50749 type:complete len:243 (-) Transcript_15541:824-1552(-)
MASWAERARSAASRLRWRRIREAARLDRRASVAATAVATAVHHPVAISTMTAAATTATADVATPGPARATATVAAARARARPRTTGGAPRSRLRSTRMSLTTTGARKIGRGGTRTTTTTARRTRRSRTGRRSAAKSTLTRRPRGVLSLPLVGRHCSHFAAGWALPALSAPRRKEGLRECALRADRRKAVAAVAGGRCSRWIKPSGAQSPLVSLPLSFKSARTSPPSAAAVWPAQCARGSLAL